MVDEKTATLARALEPAALEMEPESAERLGITHSEVALSQAISLKRIADALGEGSPFLAALAGVLDDASHNHQQRLRNL